jgi:hypothetical protein
LLVFLLLVEAPLGKPKYLALRPIFTLLIMDFHWAKQWKVKCPDFLHLEQNDPLRHMG